MPVDNNMPHGNHFASNQPLCLEWAASGQRGIKR